VAADVIEAIREGAVLFAWYPDPRWLETSRFVGARTRS
jgi:hypothetical protein